MSSTVKSAQPREGLFAHSISTDWIAYWLPLWRNFITHNRGDGARGVKTCSTVAVRGEQTLECQGGGANVGAESSRSSAESADGEPPNGISDMTFQCRI